MNSRKEKKQILLYSAGFFTLFTIIVLTVSVILYFVYDINNLHYIIKESEEKENLIINNNISTGIKHIISDLFVLSESEELQKMIAHDTNYDSLCRFFSIFSLEKKIYDQIRYINASGMEQCRVNYSKGTAIIVDTANLQNKQNRYYFKDTISLNYKNIFISPLDLNIEKGAIETPIKPMIRFATPVYSKNEKKGIIILNYLAENLLTNIQQSHNKETTNSELEYIFLINREGYYFNHPEESKNWGFMYNDTNRSFKTDYPQAWQKISAAPRGHFQTTQGIFTFSTVYPYKIEEESLDLISSSGSSSPHGTSEHRFETSDYYWQLVSFIPTEYLRLQSRTILQRYILVDSIILFFLIFISFFIANLTVKKRLIQADLVASHKKLLEADTIKNRFFSILAHDLKGPFNGLIGFAELLYSKIDTLPPETGKEYAHHIYESARIALDLLNNLLVWGRLQMGSQEIHKKTINITDIIQNTIDLTSMSMEKKKLTVENLVGKDIFCLADINMTSFIIRNILNNAVKFTPEEGKITLSAKQTEDTVIITISDTGVGIPEKSLAKLFKLDEHISTLGTQNEKGSGLGLVICNEFLEKNNGAMWVKSSPGGGSTFEFSLPIK